MQTLCWYVPLVAGPHKIGNSLGGGQVLTKAVEDGYVLFLIAPDWRSKGFEQDIPREAGVAVFDEDIATSHGKLGIDALQDAVIEAIEGKR